MFCSNRWGHERNGNIIWAARNSSVYEMSWTTVSAEPGGDYSRLASDSLGDTETLRLYRDGVLHCQIIPGTVHPLAQHWRAHQGTINVRWPSRNCCWTATNVWPLFLDHKIIISFGDFKFRCCLTIFHDLQHTQNVHSTCNSDSNGTSESACYLQQGPWTCEKPPHECAPCVSHSLSGIPRIYASTHPPTYGYSQFT